MLKIKENADLKNLANNKNWISPCYVAQNYIPKSKIKEKIEELKKEKEEYLTVEWEMEDLIEAQIEVLQELLD